jgi:pimeloyl-ACP methyl ester carboxylesterase
MVPAIVGERLGKLIPDAEFVWLDEGSHFAHVDATDAFVPLVLDFLS